MLNEFGDSLMRGEMDEGTLTKALPAIRVGNRPGRYEPREVKRKPRKYKELKKARSERRVELRTDPEGEKGRKGGGKHRATRRGSGNRGIVAEKGGERGKEARGVRERGEGARRERSGSHRRLSAAAASESRRCGPAGTWRNIHTNKNFRM